MYLEELIAAVQRIQTPIRLERLVEVAHDRGVFHGEALAEVLERLEAMKDQVISYQTGRQISGEPPLISIDASTLICYPPGRLPSPAPVEDRMVTAKAELAGQIREALLDMDSFDFEHFCAAYLNARGYRDCVVRQGDHGIDVEGFFYARDFRIKVLAQAKCWGIGNDVRAADIRDFAGSLTAEQAIDPRIPIQGFFITTSSFTDGAETEQRRAAVPILLVNGNSLVGALIEMEAGCVKLEVDPFFRIDSRYPLEWFKDRG